MKKIIICVKRGSSTEEGWDWERVEKKRKRDGKLRDVNKSIICINTFQITHFHKMITCTVIIQC